MSKMGEQAITERVRALGAWQPARPTEGLWSTIRSRATARRRRRMAGLSVVVVGLFVGAAVVLVAPGDDSAQVVTRPPAPQPEPFAGLAPGWHDFDTGPVPADVFSALVWTGEELIVGTTTGQVFAHEPTGATWRALAPMPWAVHASLGRMGDRMVAVEELPPYRSALWDPDTDTWSELGPVPSAPELSVAGGEGPDAADGGHALVWTGERLFDISRMAVLDPEQGTWSALPLPVDVIPYTGLLGSTPVWDGHEVVLVSLTGPGLAWDAIASAYRVVPAPPPELAGVEHVAPDGVAVGLDGRVVIVTHTDAGVVEAFDARTDTWSAMPSVPGMAMGEGCPKLAAAVGGHLVVEACDGSLPVHLDGGEWRPTGPVATETCCMTQWLAMGDVLLSWSSDTDTHNNPDAPYLRARIWVPPD